MDAELSEHLNARNGNSEKTVHTEHGSVRIEQPRDRAGSFEPQIVPRHQRRFAGFDERIVAMYARGMSVRDIQSHLRELYHVEVGHDLISRVTDAVLEDVREWQARPLEDVYPILFLDALIAWEFRRLRAQYHRLERGREPGAARPPYASHRALIGNSS